jgi:hypothetical protein
MRQAGTVSLAKRLIMHRRTLNTLLSEMPKMKEPCRYFLFLTKVDGVLEPILCLLTQLAMTQSKGVFSRFIADLEKSNDLISSIKSFTPKIKGQKDLCRKLQWLSLVLREFIFMFGTSEDHKRLFNDWNLRTTPKCFVEAADIMVRDAVISVCAYAIHFQSREKRKPSEEEIRIFLKSLFCSKLFMSYYKKRQSGLSIERKTQLIDSVLSQYAEDFLLFESALSTKSKRSCRQIDKGTTSVINFFELHFAPERNTARPVEIDYGVEIEFQAPKSEVDISHLAQTVRKRTTFSGLSTFPSNAAYLNRKGGVLMVDESLPRLKGYFPVEFASPILSTRVDLKHIENLAHGLRQKRCVVDESSGVHVHVSRKSFSKKSLKTLAIRFARQEDDIRKVFFDDTRISDNNMYGPSLLSLFGDTFERKNQAKNFILLTHFVRRARTLDEIHDAASAGSRYTSLNVKTKYDTIEFRGHPGTLSGKRISNYVEFILDFAAMAKAPMPSQSCNRRLVKTLALRARDRTIRLHDPLNVVSRYNLFKSSAISSTATIQKIVRMHDRVTQNIHLTQKLADPYHNYDGQLNVRGRYE